HPVSPTVFASLSTIVRGYPQKIGSYPHPYVEADYTALCNLLPSRMEMRLLLALFALVVIEIERVDELAEWREALLIGDLGLALFGDRLFDRRVVLVFGRGASALEDMRFDIDRDIGAHSESDGIARTRIDLDCVAALLDDDAGEEGVVVDI